MNVTYQKCDNCGASNTANDPNWVRLLGAYKGSPTVVTAPSSATLASGTVRSVSVDLCTDCITKLNVLDLVTLTTTAAAKATITTSSSTSTTSTAAKATTKS